MQLPPVAATTVGSFPRPSWLASPARGGAVFVLEGDALHEAKDDATIVSLREQEAAGLDLLSDGEQRRVGFINHVIAAWDGVDMERMQSKMIRRRHTERPVPTVTGKIQRRAQATVEDLRFAKAHTSKPIKATVPGPMTVVDTTYDEAYSDEEAEAMDVAAALNAELLELQAAGADVVQIDEPAMTRYHEKVASYGARTLDRCLEGITVPSFVHLCYGYPSADTRQHEFEYPELLDMLMETNIGGFSVEFGRSGYDPAILKRCEGRFIMYGCIDPGDSPVEPVNTVAERVRHALQYIDPQHTLVAPDCGLMTVSRDLARAKARLIADVSAEIQRTL